MTRLGDVITNVQMAQLLGITLEQLEELERTGGLLRLNGAVALFVPTSPPSTLH